jgi:hypothetical protein
MIAHEMQKRKLTAVEALAFLQKEYAGSVLDLPLERSHALANFIDAIKKRGADPEVEYRKIDDHFRRWIQPEHVCPSGFTINKFQTEFDGCILEFKKTNAVHGKADQYIIAELFVHHSDTSANVDFITENLKDFNLSMNGIDATKYNFLRVISPKDYRL